jgi:hypothetical protein
LLTDRRKHLLRLLSEVAVGRHGRLICRTDELGERVGRVSARLDDDAVDWDEVAAVIEDA